MPRAVSLTHRQLEVLELVARGLTNPEIASVLGIGLGTVKKHVTAVIEALDVSNRTEAAGLLAQLELGRCVAASPGQAVAGFGERPLLAVLPFEDLRPGSDSGWLTRGLLSDLTARVGGLRWFPVIQAESLAGGGFVGRGDAIGARYVIEGTILRDADRVVVSVRGRDEATGDNIWARRFEGPAAGLPAMQQEIVTSLVEELEPALLRLEQVRASRREADSAAVWELCKRAEHRLGLETPGGYAQAVELFEQAISIDRTSPSAWSGLALSHGAAIYLGLVDDLRPTAARAREAADVAIDLAPDDFDSRFTMGRCLALSRDDEAAVPVLEAALESDPSSAIAANTLAGALRRQGHAAASIPWYERALHVSPRSPQVYHVHGGLSLAHLSSGDYQSALDHASLAVRGDANDGGGKVLDFYPVVPASLALLGRVDEARAAWQKVDRQRMRHSARFTGARLEALAEGLRIAGWDGRLE